PSAAVTRRRVVEERVSRAQKGMAHSPAVQALIEGANTVLVLRTGQVNASGVHLVRLNGEPLQGLVGVVRPSVGGRAVVALRLTVPGGTVRRVEAVAEEKDTFTDIRRTFRVAQPTSTRGWQTT